MIYKLIISQNSIIVCCFHIESKIYFIEVSEIIEHTSIYLIYNSSNNLEIIF